MPTGTEPGCSRRQALALGWAAVPWPALARPASVTLCTAWDDALGQSQVGVLRLHPQRPQVQRLASVPVPTRAHGVLWRPDGSVLAVSRRPGDWLLRWNWRRGQHAFFWNDAGRRFNGHLALHEDAVLTTETDLADGSGCIVVRDAQTLRERAVWPTHGRDPHDFEIDAVGRLWVANGGIATDPATGRAKDLRTMDPSLVCLDVRHGTLIGQWRLDDPRLSLRHLALRADGAVGMALQAEHDDPAARAAAPLLALWQDDALRAVEGPSLAGYGGDIAALGNTLLVSAPRADRVAAWHPDHGWSDGVVLPQACALAASAGRLWCGGARQWCELADAPGGSSAWVLEAGWRPDNHAVI